MIQPVARLGEWLMPEESIFPIDWKMAILGALVLVGLVATVVVAVLEGLPWVTRDQMAQRDQMTQNKIDTLTSTQTTNANQLSATNAQLSALGLQVAGVVQREADDRLMIDELRNKKQVNSLKQQLRQKQYAEKLNQQHYEREVKRMEHARSVGL